MGKLAQYLSENFKLFGFSLGRSDDEKTTEADSIPSFVAPANEDGAIEIAPGGAYGTTVDFEGIAKTEADLITRYRELTLQPEVENAVDDIINESVIIDKKSQPVELILDNLNIDDSLKEKIRDEFQLILGFLNFQNLGFDIFRRWYVDGRLYYHIMVDEKRPKEGIKELRYIDPRKMRKIREPIRNAKFTAAPFGGVGNSAAIKIPPYKEWYLYKPQTMSNLQPGLAPVGEVRVSADSISYTHSGLFDQRNQMVLSYLHKVIKPMNQLRILEDATVIYRLARAPERRVFYIDVSNLPKIKAEQYMRDMMVRHKNRLVYDACLSMDTRIPLLDGRTLSLSDIQKEFEAGEKLWAYSCDPTTGKFAPGLITSAGITRRNQSVMKLTLDNGQTITCTPDHKFPVWQKGKVEAKDLIVGDSMISRAAGSHEIAKIEYLDTKIDVGTLGIDRDEHYHDHHTFALEAGVYTCNSTGDVRDDRKYMCYALDTKIPLLDGRTVSLQTIIDEYKEGKINWAYSCDSSTGKFVPGPISWAGPTKKNTQVVRVTLDNGKSLVCTPDHKFPVWDKGLVEAQNLLVGESVIPGYRRQKSIIDGGREYEQIYKNDTKTWEFTHREVTKWKNEIGLREEFVFSQFYKDESKSTIHHKDFDGFNNNPDNLVLMNFKDHLEYHHDIQSIKYSDEIGSIVNRCAQSQFDARDTIQTVNDSINLDAWRILNDNRNPKNRIVNTLVFTHKDLTRICKNADYKDWRSYRKQFDRSIREANGRVVRGTTVKYSNEWREKLSVAAKNRTKISCKTWQIISPDGQINIIENLNAYCREMSLNRNNIKRNYGSRGYRAEQLHNHKIVSVEWLDEKIDVGALTIDQEETYHSHHTYLLDVGIYTKNTMLEDFWLPRRDGSTGTEIKTLQGGQNLSRLEDVEYFKQRVYKALNVPVSRLESETQFNLGRSSEISRDELKYAKFITRLRSRFSHLFDNLLEIQLSLKGIMSRADWKTIRNDVSYDYLQDNFFTESKNGEVLNARLALLAVVTPYEGNYYSRKWIQKNILQMSEDDVVEMMEEIEEENADPAIQALKDANKPELPAEFGGDPAGAPPGASGDAGDPVPPAEDETSAKGAPRLSSHQKIVKRPSNRGGGKLKEGHLHSFQTFIDPSYNVSLEEAAAPANSAPEFNRLAETVDHAITVLGEKLARHQEEKSGDATSVPPSEADTALVEAMTKALNSAADTIISADDL